jgi:hypothetical protein
MELFEFTKIIFESPGEYQEITPGEKRKWFFLLQRRFAIQFPMQANALQHLKINQAGVVDFWQHFMRKQYQKTPGWMYTKGIKKSKEEKEKKIKVSETLINQYAAKMEIDKKSIYDALEFYPEQIQKELKDFEKIINQK